MRITEQLSIFAALFLFTANAFADIGFSGSAYNETSLINNDGTVKYGNRSSLHLKAESLTQGVKLVSELEFYTMYGYLSSESSEISKLMKDGQFYVDRLYMRIPVHKIDIIIGKQRIAWGSSFIFRPTDNFNKPNPLSLSGRKEGVNALLAKAFTGGLSSVEFVLAPPDAFEQIGGTLKYGKLGMRLSTNYLKTDTSVSYQYNGYKKSHMLGLDIKGDLKLGYHIETAYTYIIDDSIDNYIQSVLGLDYSFLGKFILLGEYLYNGHGLKSEGKLPADNFSLLDDFGYRHYLYSRITYQPDIFIGANIFTLWNMIDRSLIISPGIIYSFFQNTELQIYSQIFLGGNTDEYSSKRLGADQIYYLKLIVRF